MSIKVFAFLASFALAGSALASDGALPVANTNTPKQLDTPAVEYAIGYEVCPFDTDFECYVWERKPTIRETYYTSSPYSQNVTVDMIVSISKVDPDNISYYPEIEPLMERYRTLQKVSRTCCTEGMIHRMKKSGATKKELYKFVVDDVNNYGVGERCLMMTDKELNDDSIDEDVADFAKDARNACLCHRKKWFRGLLAPFEKLYETRPDFADSTFEYHYRDGLARDVSVSVNKDVSNVLRQLDACP